VCNGLAAFLHIDPTIVRLIFAALVFFTGGGFVIVYIVLALVVPEADTSEERAAAYGEPFNAQRLIDRAKQQYADKSRNWSQAWRREQRAWRRQWRRGQRWRDAGMYGPPPAGYGTRILARWSSAECSWRFAICPRCGNF
jgi:phage shock protein PspC (stress-responsive transcriptional regulator)